ncbi:MAG TPA: glutathione S-transferase family protein [Terriglobia bacterium]|nr:glutathione S-transferase family protein [Terriglobia bacterium]
MLTLISHHLCPYVQRVAIALAEKRIPFERTYVDLAAKPDWFLAISPLGKVPLLRCDAGVLFESAVICEYLEDAYPETSLLPADPWQRARLRGWVEFATATLADIWGFETAQDEVATRGKALDLRKKFIRVEEVLDGGPFFSGGRFSLVDAAFAPVFRYFDLFDQIADFGVFADLKRVAAWRDHLAARESVQNAVTPDYRQRLSQFLAKRQAYLHLLAEEQGATARTA